MHSDWFGIGFALALVIGSLIGTLGYRYLKRRDRQSLEKKGLRAEAEVLEVWQDGAGLFCITYRFTPLSGGEPVLRTEYAGCLQAGLPAAGEKVYVIYDPGAPHVAHLLLHDR
jgi:hypothetical protein